MLSRSESVDGVKHNQGGGSADVQRVGRCHWVSGRIFYFSSNHIYVSPRL